jgi:hypothetical protein
MSDPGLTLDAECFQGHIASFEFREGEELGSWGLLLDKTVQWPNAVIWIAAAPRPQSPDRYHLFFNLAHYPKVGPTAYLWDIETKAKLALAKWPKGVGDVKMAFRTDWNNAAALYCPWDRVAAEGHPDWAVKHAGQIWTSGHTIVHYLRRTHELLISDEYYGS